MGVLNAKKQCWPHTPCVLWFHKWEERDGRAEGAQPAPWVLRPWGRTNVYSGASPSLGASLCFLWMSSPPFKRSRVFSLSADEHYFTQLEYSWAVSGVTFSCFPMKIPSFLCGLSPSHNQYLTLIYPALLFLRSMPFSDLFTLSSHPSPALAMDFLSRAVFYEETKFCQFTKVAAYST